MGVAALGVAAFGVVAFGVVALGVEDFAFGVLLSFGVIGLLTLSGLLAEELRKGVACRPARLALWAPSGLRDIGEVNDTRLAA